MCSNNLNECFGVLNGTVVSHYTIIGSPWPTVRELAQGFGLSEMFTVEPAYIGKINNLAYEAMYWKTPNGYLVLFFLNTQTGDYLDNKIFYMSAAEDLRYLNIEN